MCDVIVLGSGLNWLDAGFSNTELSFVMSADSRLARCMTPSLRVTLTLIKERV